DGAPHRFRPVSLDDRDRAVVHAQHHGRAAAHGGSASHHERGVGEWEAHAPDLDGAHHAEEPALAERVDGRAWKDGVLVDRSGLWFDDLCEHLVERARDSGLRGSGSRHDTGTYRTTTGTIANDCSLEGIRNSRRRT